MFTRAIAFLVLCLFLSSKIALADDSSVIVAEVTSVEHGKITTLQWDARISQIAALPAWNSSNGKFPLSVDDAIKIARTRLTKAFPAVYQWKLDELTLLEIKNNSKFLPQIMEKYCYRVSLLPVSDQEVKEIEKSENGELSYYEVILSDGTALDPQRKVGDD